MCGVGKDGLGAIKEDGLLLATTDVTGYDDLQLPAFNTKR